MSKTSLFSMPKVDKTCKDVVEWIETNNQNNLTQSQWKEEAVLFFGKFEIRNKATIVKMVNQFQIDHEREKNKTCRSIMKNLGGTVGKVRGRHDNPPLGYFPSDFTEIKIIKVEGEFFICSKCDKNFLCDIEMRGHIEANHTNEVKKYFAKHCNNMVKDHLDYRKWLERKATLKFEVNKQPVKKTEQQQRIEKLQRENIIIKAYNKNTQEDVQKILNEQENSFKIVKERSAGKNIIETKRTIFTQKKDGTIKKSVLTEQMANVTTRKRLHDKDTHEVTKIKRKSGEGERKQVENLDSILQHLTGQDFDSQVSILSKFIEQKGPEFSLLLVNNSPALQKGLKYTPQQTAALISATGISDNVATKLITAANKTFGWNQFASLHKVKQIRVEVLPINR